jgi:DNA-directed RNA polymerase beta subunit
MTERTEVDELLKLRPEFLGIHAIDPFVDSDSSARSIMKGSHISQALTLINGTEKIITTGIDRELGKYTFSAAPDDDCTVLYVVPRYKEGHSSTSIPMNPETLVIYENAKTRAIGCFSIPYYKTLHQHFGFKYEKTPSYTKLIPGEPLQANEAVADTPAKKSNGGYAYGVELNVALMSHPGVAEDGMIVSRDALEKLKFRVFEKRSVEFGMRSFPINLYGDENNYKPFPEIGDRIHESGAIMVLRKYDPELAPVMTSIYDTMEPDFTFDEPIYVRGSEGKVVDIKVFHNPGNKPGLYSGIMDSMGKYVNALEQFYSNLLNIEEEIRRDRMSKFGSRDVEFEPEFHRLLVEAYSMVNGNHSFLNSRGIPRVKKLYRGDPVDEYRIEFVIEYEITPTVGYKLSALHGDP